MPFERGVGIVAAFEDLAVVRFDQWDNLDLIYFSGYATWTYLTTS